MGLFSRKKADPIAHPAVRRTIYVRAPATVVEAHLEGYSALAGKGGAAAELLLAESAGWTAIALPMALHPWVFHNLAFWMLDCPGSGETVVAESEAGPGYPAYLLVKDPEIDACLCGWDADGAGWTVFVPSNDIVRGEGVPTGHNGRVPGGFEEWTAVAVRLENPGRAQNPANDGTARSRDILQRQAGMFWSP